MYSGTIAFLLGIAALLALPTLPEPLALILGGLLATLLLFRLRHSHPVRWLVWATVGALWALWHAQGVVSIPIPSEWEGREMTVEGYIDSLPDVDNYRTRFEFLATARVEQGHPLAGPGLLRLAWYDAAPTLQPGQWWRLRVKLKRPHGFANPGGFDYEGWLLRHGIAATGYVRGGEVLPRPPTAGIDRWRAALRAGLPTDTPLGGIMAALAVGDRSGIDAAQWDLLAATGTTHLMAISGLHIGMVALLAFATTRRVWRWWPGLALHLPAPRIAALAAFLAALGYALLAGFSIPTQRALVMLAVGLGAVTLGREIRPSRALAGALLAVLIYDPLAVMEPGFWLSFGAVAALLLSSAGRSGRPRWWLQWGRSQWWVTLGMLPIMALLFGRMPLSAPLANLLAIPWVGFVVVPLLLLATLVNALLPSVGGVLLSLAEQALVPIWWWLEQVAALPLGWWILTPPPWTLLLALPALLWLLAPQGWPARWLGWPLLAPLLLLRPPTPNPGELWLTVLDVGQGLAAVVRTEHHLLVFDTGPAFAELDAGRMVVAPYLRHLGLQQADMLIVSHGDNDHSGGAESLLATVAFGAVRTGPLALPGRYPGCRQGERWQWDGVRFEILNPAGGDGGSENDRSCVLRVAAAGGSVLLAADIEAAGEAALMARAGQRLTATALVVPHHGSRSSSSAAFVTRVQPRYAVFSVGYRNRWGFPAPQVVARYQAQGSQLLRTDEAGAITLLLPVVGAPQVSSYRRAPRRWWQEPEACSGSLFASTPVC